MESDILKGLNSSQKEAVTNTAGPVLVLAGAGSGKTRTIAYRIVYLIKEKDISPSNILAVTFTNKAANEMKERVHHLIGGGANKLWIGTFHSVCLRILKRDIDKLEGFRRDFIIYDESDQIKLIRECMNRLGLSERIFDAKAVRSQIDSAKNKGLSPGDFGTNIYDEKVSRVYHLYEEELRQSNALDFGDLLSFTVTLFEKRPDVLRKYQDQFHYVLIDEYQDTNHLQYRIIKLLSEKHRNVFVVGDDNQSIYGWRGADITNILNFEKDFPDASVIKLEQNYRSTKNILKAASELILRNRYRRDKRLWTENDEGELIAYYEARDERDEARYIVSEIRYERDTFGRPYSDFAVFYRTNNQSRLIEEELIYSGIPYTIVGGVGFYERAEIKDIMAYLRVIANPFDEISLRRIINVPPRGIGRGTVEALAKIAEERDIPLLEAIKIALDEELLSKKASNSLKKFNDLLSELIQLSKRLSTKDLIEKVLEKTNYLEIYDSDRNEERQKNMGEILNLAAEFEKEEENTGIHDFLDWITLSSDVDRFNEKADQVTLMTLHCAKGLEFPVVFTVGMEESIFPHIKSLGNGRLIEEERRLCYVGITRAKEKLYLTSTSKRRFFGIEQRSIPSRFVTEIPRKLLHWKSYQMSSNRQNLMDFDADQYSLSTNDNVFHKSGNGYTVGQKVSHPSFGRGTVKNIEGMGEEAKVVISFPNYGEKKIMASFLGLKKI
ncbi:MAG TPA: UvrD-helicase domain-containing protein [Thermodesulfobacteriota bacterium]|nr:UvrD-helicase domain-containing protein [Thermodesulfobacteriota bacterium]